MLTRLYNARRCREITDKYPDYFTFDAESWFSDPKNWAAEDGDNVGFAEWKGQGTYWVHFCYDTARGKAAIQLAKDMLSQLFQDEPINTAVGLIEVRNRSARWVVRQVGMKSLGTVNTENGLCEMFYLTKEDIDNGIFVSRQSG